MCHGWSEIEGTFYLFDEWNGIHKPGWRKENDKIYYYSGNDRYYGEKLIDGNWYYFNPEKEGEMATGWSEHHGHTYYYNKYGAMQYGWNNINGTEYYFCKVTGIYIKGFYRTQGETY